MSTVKNLIRRGVVLGLAAAGVCALRSWLRGRAGDGASADPAPAPPARPTLAVVEPPVPEAVEPVAEAPTALVKPVAAAPPVPEAAPGEPVAETPPAWVPPNDDGSAPDTHPVKVAHRSNIYHVPGGAFYDRTTPARCYASAAAAEADGHRPAKS